MRILLLLRLLLLVVLLPACTSVGNSAYGKAFTKGDYDPWLGRDKYYHVLSSAAIAAVTTTIVEDNSSNNCAPMLGIGITLSVGAMKEWHDKAIKKTYFSWKDMFWNVVGATVGSLAVSQCNF